MNAHSRNKLIILITLMSVVAIATAGVTLVVLYRAAYQQQSVRLVELVQSQARFLESIARHHPAYQKPQYRDTLITETVAQLQEVLKDFKGLGKTGAFHVAKQDADRITYLLKHGETSTQDIGIIVASRTFDQAMTLSLEGQSGIIPMLDYRGVKVLAAYEPIKELNLGLVSKIDLSEIEKPFIKAGILSCVVGFVLIVIGTFLFRSISMPILANVEEKETQLHVILDNVVDAIVTIDYSGLIESFNKSAENIFGYQASEVIGKNINLLMAAALRNEHDSYLQNYHKTGEEQIIGIGRELTAVKKNGELFPIDLSVSKAQIGKRLVFTGIIRDITARKKTEEELLKYRNHLEEQVTERTSALEIANQKLEKLARIDSLTGIANRREFDRLIEAETRRSAREKKAHSLIICDIDFFKLYNDTYGHPAGDDCLKRVAEAMEKTFPRAGELVARYGGEEFAVILPDSDAQEAKVLADKLRRIICELNIPHASSEVSNTVTISLGVATVPAGKWYPTAHLIQIADKALYRAKAKGRNSVEAETIAVNLQTKNASNASGKS